MKNKQDKYLIFPLFSTPLVVPEETYQFNKKELNYIKKLKTTKNSYNRSSINKYLLKAPELSSIKKYLEKWLNIYAHEFLKIKGVKFYITQSWCNYNAVGDKHHAHIHPNSLISGVFYIQGDKTPIEFGRDKNLLPLQVNHESFHIYNARTYWVNVETGKLFLFPSTLNHSVKKNVSKTKRISLSFNTYARGEFGEAYKLTHLKLK